MIPASLPLICPLCHAALQRGEARWHCAAGHSFDVAREGYLNLLPVQRKKSRAPGDNAAMIRARREFLDAGHYAPLRDALPALLAPRMATGEPGLGLDLGCGEGYYSAAIRDALAPGGELVGLDISRDAVQAAARRHPAISWLVASGVAVPLADASCALVTSLFAPVPAAEIARLLRPGGHLLVVVPGAMHLQFLRAALFDEVRAHEPGKVLAGLEGGFSLRERREATFPLTLDTAALGQLLLMTPYAWRAQPERVAALRERGPLVTEAEFTLFLLERA